MRASRYHTLCLCDACQGTGGTSSHLGSFTMEEFREQFDAEEQEEYFSGRYDKPCSECKGSGRVEVYSGGAPFAFRRALVQQHREEEALAACEMERAAEMRHFGYH